MLGELVSKLKWKIDKFQKNVALGFKTKLIFHPQLYILFTFWARLILLNPQEAINNQKYFPKFCIILRKKMHFYIF